MEITIETTIKSTLTDVWRKWTNPDDIKNWNFASSDWICPKAQNRLVVGERFSYRMESKDGSMGFNFEGTYTAIDPEKKIEFALDDERRVQVRFEEVTDGIRVSETFTAEDQNSAEQQRQGWQSILDNFKAHVEKKSQELLK